MDSKHTVAVVFITLVAFSNLTTMNFKLKLQTGYFEEGQK